MRAQRKSLMETRDAMRRHDFWIGHQTGANTLDRAAAAGGREGKFPEAASENAGGAG
jgi:hypothetical protein